MAKKLNQFPEDIPMEPYGDWDRQHGDDVKAMGSHQHDDSRVYSYLTRRRTHAMFHEVNSCETVLSFLPSRNIGVLESSEESDMPFLSSPREPEMPQDNHAANIVSVMEKDTALMEDNPLSEQLRMEALRGMPESLTTKRLVKNKLVKTVSRKSKHHPISLWKRFKYRISMSFSKSNTAFKNVLYSFELWYSSLKVIEGHFGSGVATYFKFLRWLFILNFIVFILSLSFVVIPQLLNRFYESVTDEYCRVNATSASTDTNHIGNSTQLPFEDFNTIVPLPVITPEGLNQDPNPDYIVNPDNYFPRIKASPYSMNNNFSVGNIFTGSGFLTDTILYYGFYSNDTIRLNCFMDYNLPSGYFFTALFCYLLVFITLSVSMARSYRKSFIETSGGLNNVYANKVFCSWDFGIATGEAAALKSKSIYNELKELLNESADMLEESSCVTWFYTFDDAATDQSDEHTHSMMMSLVVTIIMMFSPIFFSWLIRFEYYENPRTVLYMTLMRTFFLKMIVIGVLVAFWLKRSNRKCWETSLGQEVYRLILTDFLIAIVGTALAELVRNRIYKTVWKGIGVPKFDIARNTLNLIYNQTLFFVGLYFSPLLPLIIVLKMFITFHIKKDKESGRSRDLISHQDGSPE